MTPSPPSDHPGSSHMRHGPIAGSRDPHSDLHGDRPRGTRHSHTALSRFQVASGSAAVRALPCMALILQLHPAKPARPYATDAHRPLAQLVLGSSHARATPLPSCPGTGHRALWVAPRHFPPQCPLFPGSRHKAYSLPPTYRTVVTVAVCSVCERSAIWCRACCLCSACTRTHNAREA